MKPWTFLILFTLSRYFMHAQCTLLTADQIGSIGILQRASSAIDYFTLKSVGLISGFSSTKISVHDNCTVHVLDFKGRGSLPPMLLVHGLSSCAADYYPIIWFLQEECQRVIAVDLPGHGLSEVDVRMPLEGLEELMIRSITETIKKLNLGPCILVGNSLGGFISTKACLRMKGKVCGLVLLSPAGAPNSEEELHRMKSMFEMKTVSDASVFVDKMLGKSVPWGFRFIIGWFMRERARRPGVRAILNSVTINSRLSTVDVASIRCPVLLVWGKREDLFSEAHFQWFRKNFSQKNLRVFCPSSIGHVPHVQSHFSLKNTSQKYAELICMMYDETSAQKNRKN